MAYTPNTTLTFTKTGYVPSTTLEFNSLTDVLSVREPSTDGFLSSGVVKDPNSLSATENLSDQFQSVGGIQITGNLLPTESGNDVFLALPIRTGDLVASENSTDSLVSTGLTIYRVGDLSATEAETDSYLSLPTPIVGTLSTQELETDNYLTSASKMAITEESTDTFKSLSTVIVGIESIQQQNITSIFTSNTLPDLVIPISTLSLTLNKENTSSANIVIPNGQKYDELIRNYLDDSGWFVLKYTDVLTGGEIEIKDSQEFLISSVSSSRGGRNWSIQVGGSNLTDELSQISKIDLRDVSLFRTNTNGSATFRTAMDRRLLAGDIAIYDQVEYPITKITQVANPTNIYMEVSTL